jgi:hypothetical protein
MEVSMSQFEPFAPELKVSQWLNVPTPISLASLRGRVVVIHAFQMLCPGCVSHGIPQATTIRRTFAEEDVVVLGLHTVFEHHDVMNAAALKTFIHEYRLTFPVGIDQAARDSDIPLTMQAYNLRGTPSLLIIDRNGRLRFNYFGRLDDMTVGSLIGQMVNERVDPGARQPVGEQGTQTTGDATKGCDDTVCGIDN